MFTSEPSFLQESMYSDCMTLLKGQYITIQPNSPDGTRYIEASIVKVLAYCGNPEADEKVQCMPVDLDSCANRDLITESKTKTRKNTVSNT